MEQLNETQGETAVSPQSLIFRITVTPRQPQSDRRLVQAAHQLGITSLDAIYRARLYFLQGNITTDDAKRLAQELLADPVTEEWSMVNGQSSIANGSLTIDNWQLTIDHFLETTFLPGVTDPPADNLVRAAHLLGIGGVERAATGHWYGAEGDLTTADLNRLATEICANPVIQRFTVNLPIRPPFFPYDDADDTVETIPLRHANEAQLRAISQERRLALNPDEMEAIRGYFRSEQRDPTDVELETLAQTWSEHCVHKTFKATIDYTGPDGQETIDGILKSYIRAATEEVDKPWVRSAFVDNAGIVAFDGHFDLAFKVETHNHPSALEPFGGANTGVGGVVRDVLGVSARPIANTDVLCFGLPDADHEELPEGVLHPRRIAEGVIHGIEDYGNKMGIPTVNGSIHYDAGYTANPLVYCGCLGILPRGSHPTELQPGDLIVAIGGRTGRDGLRGATFSSMEMDVETSEIAGTAVQIGHPIMEKQVQEVVLRARDEGLYNAITDCGAGGFSSAVGEMGEQLGAVVRLENAKLKYPGLRPWEIWLSEAQERMVLAVPPGKWERLQAICAGQDVEAIHLGEFEDSGRLRLTYNGKLVADLAMGFLHHGLPPRRLRAVWQPVSREPSAVSREPSAVSREPSAVSRKPSAVTRKPSTDYGSRTTDYGLRTTDHGLRTTDHGLRTTGEMLLTLLAHPDVRSKEDVVRRYDHEVQGGTAVKPLVGIANHGPGDAAVLVPVNCQLSIVNYQLSMKKGVALANGVNPHLADVDPYIMAWAAVDEALRNVVAVGADPDQVSILDNFCWGNPELPDRLGALVRCAQGCYDAAVAYQTPFISGKDSLNNEYTGADGEKHAIPGTLLVSALGIVPDVAKTITMDLKQPGNFLFVVGETGAELAGSHYAQVGGHVREQHHEPPKPVKKALDRFRKLHQAMQAGLVQSCHDCAEGGLGVAVAEMGIAGGLGVAVQLVHAPRDLHWAYSDDEVILFSESLSRFLVEVRPADADRFREIMGDVPHECVGVIGGERLRVNGRSAQPLLDLSLDELENAWRGHLGGDRYSVIGDRYSVGSEKSDQSPVSNLQSPIPNPQSPIPNPQSPTSSLQPPPKVLILHANGANRDRDAALACQLAGGDPEIVHINQLLAGERRLADYAMLVVPGGFSYGDDLGAGVLWSVDLHRRFGDEMWRFVEDGRPVLGICNGFQVLVKAGLLEWPMANCQLPMAERSVTLTFNESGRFECRWVYLRANGNSPCIFTQDLDELIYCPVAHGEGRLAVRDRETLAALQERSLIALRYTDPVIGDQYSVIGERSAVPYPVNPNGSVMDIAGLTNPAGNVLGLMPHPEDHVFAWQHPRYHRGERGMLGLRLFANGLRHV